ncbi:unnamed protein product [Symbiodinium microadriaticum]|nr:unnamed protein product [Symbiodinium microadriaticum]
MVRSASLKGMRGEHYKAGVSHGVLFTNVKDMSRVCTILSFCARVTMTGPENADGAFVVANCGENEQVMRIVVWEEAKITVSTDAGRGSLCAKAQWQIRVQDFVNASLPWSGLVLPLIQKWPSPDGSRMLRLQIVDGTGQERRVDIHVDPTTTVAQLKDGNYLGVDFAVGWRLRCVFRGRLLSEMEPLGRLPSGAFLQCYLQRPSTVESADGLELDPLLVAWARLAGVGRNTFPPEKWQDVVFHCAFIIGLAVAWSAYLGSPDVFDGFGSLALRFLTISWVFCPMMCAGDATAVVTTGCFRSSSELLHVLGAEDTAAGLGTEDKAARSGVLRRCGVGVHRTADALQALKRVLLWIVSGHFVDDFFGVDIDELADGAFDGMAGFLDLISEAGQGAHHPGRIQKIQATIGDALAKDDLAPHDDSTLCHSPPSEPSERQHCSPGLLYDCRTAPADFLDLFAARQANVSDAVSRGDLATRSMRERQATDPARCRVLLRRFHFHSRLADNGTGFESGVCCTRRSYDVAGY